MSLKKGLQISVNESRRSVEKNSGLELFSLILLFVGFAKVFLSGFSVMEYTWPYVAAVGVVISFILGRLYAGKWKDYISLAGTGVLIVIIIIGNAAVRNGYYVLVNEWFRFLTGKTGKIYLDYPASGTKGTGMLVTIIFLLVILILSGAIYTGRRYPVLILLGIAFAGSIYGFFQTDYGWLILTAGIIAFASSRKWDAVRTGNVWVTCGIMLVLLVLCGGAAVGTIAQTDPDMGRTADNIQRNIHRMLYDDRIDAMPEGNLSNLSGLEKSEKTALKMKMEQPQKLYLRGKILEVYTGNAWKPYAAETRIKHEDLFYWLHKTGFYGQNMISNAASLEEKVEKAKLTVENVSACEEHPYLPYAISEDSYLDARGIGDDTGCAGSENVEMTYLSGSVPQWYQLAVYLSGHQEEEKVQEYLKQEQSYREFVYENDLQITDRAVGVCKRIWGEDESSRSLSEILDLVRDTLNKRLKYDENTKTANGKNDFFAYTMEQNKSGYSVHYATAATLMLRYLGVPARYVEGYYLSTEEAQQYQKNQEIDLTEAHAHAWTEYYMDGVGWIPFEVTPGYIEKEEIDLLGDMMTKDAGTHSGKSYSQNQKALSYTPPKSQQEQQQKPDVRNQFRFQARQVVSMILVIIVLVLLAAVVWILRRRYRLQKFRKMIEESDHRTVILELYSYTGMLKRRCGIEMSGREEEISAIYQEARFSNHDLNDEKAGIMRQYTDEVISACMTHCGHLAKLWYKYVLWIFDSKKYFI